MKIKIRNTEYKIRKGDYIMDNGHCYQLCSGDGRLLKMRGFDRYGYILLTKKVMKSIDLSTMPSKKYPRYTNYYFTDKQINSVIII